MGLPAKTVNSFVLLFIYLPGEKQRGARPVGPHVRINLPQLILARCTALEAGILSFGLECVRLSSKLCIKLLSFRERLLASWVCLPDTAWATQPLLLLAVAVAAAAALPRSTGHLARKRASKHTMHTHSADSIQTSRPCRPSLYSQTEVNCSGKVYVLVFRSCSACRHRVYYCALSFSLSLHHCICLYLSWVCGSIVNCMS